MVGASPLVRVNGIFAKLECTHPCGSIKDRIAEYILAESEKRGLLEEGMPIVEATSGNTGIALAYFGRLRGHPVTIVMPEHMTDERKLILRRLGAELILCSQEGGFAEAVALRDRLARERGCFNPDQFSNTLNPECHYMTTGMEIAKQARDAGLVSVDAFVAGVGTGGTLMGVGRRLREFWPGVRLVAVEPSESALMSGGSPGPHGIAGIGDGFIPALVSDGRRGLNPLIDEVLCVSTGEAREAARHLAEAHGYCVGISSGANFVAASRLRQRFSNLVTVFPDGYWKYQSEGLRHCEAGRCPYEHEPVAGPESWS